MATLGAARQVTGLNDGKEYTKIGDVVAHKSF